MAVRTLAVEARSKGRMSVKVNALIVTEPGTLTNSELDTLRSDLAGRLMVVLTELRYLHVPLSEIKVKRR